MNAETAKMVARLRRTADVCVTHIRPLDINMEHVAIDLRQAANTIEDLAKCQELVADIAEMGLRCDLHPTVILDDEECSMYSRMQQYLERQDSSMRERARQALNA